MMDRDQIVAALADVNAQLAALTAEMNQDPMVFSQEKTDMLYTLTMRQEELQQALAGLNSSADQDQLDINILSSLIPPMPKP